MPVVYVLHFHTPPIIGKLGEYRHHVGIADSEEKIDLSRVRHGAGWRRLEAGTAEISDIWECRDQAEAVAMRWRLIHCGVSRDRVCSICSPGNARGMGTGNWSRVGRELAPRSDRGSRRGLYRGLPTRRVRKEAEAVQAKGPISE